MKANHAIKKMLESDLQTTEHQKNDDMKKKYEVKLNLTADEISHILDYCLVQRIEHGGDEIEQYLTIAECIRGEKLSDEFCQYFASELTPLLKDLISDKNDSYQMANFQHRMLRKFSNCTPASAKH